MPLKVTIVLTTPCLTVHCGAASGRKRKYEMNEQYRSSFFSVKLAGLNSHCLVGISKCYQLQKFPDTSKTVVYCIVSYTFYYLKHDVCLNNNNKSGSVSHKTHNTFIIKIL